MSASDPSQRAVPGVGAGRARRSAALATVVALVLACGGSFSRSESGDGPLAAPLPDGGGAGDPAVAAEAPLALDTALELAPSERVPRTAVTYEPTGNRRIRLTPAESAALATEAYRTFVLEPSVTRARLAGRSDAMALLEPSRFDRELIDHLASTLDSLAKSRLAQRRLDEVRDNYATVLAWARQAGLPDVVAAIPMVESRYRANFQLWSCGKGYWSLLPETVERARQHGRLPVGVRDCHIEGRGGASSRFTPADLLPPAPFRTKAPYIDPTIEGVDPRACRISPERGCDVDDRTDLGKSTDVAFYLLSEPWEDAALARSGAAVALTVLSFHAGYHDARFGRGLDENVRPAFLAWSQEHPESEHHRFYGSALRCPASPSNERCGSPLLAETQDYGLQVLARHALAACQYGRFEEGSPAVFEPYRQFAAKACGSYGLPELRKVLTPVEEP